MKTTKNTPRNDPRAGQTTINNRSGSGSANENEQENNGLREMLLEEIADVYNAEQQLLTALPKMAEAAQSEALREAFESHLAETEAQAGRLEEALTLLEEEMKTKKCKAMEGLLKEGTELLEEHQGKATIDAALIAAAQKVEHYEIASYGTLCAWARHLGEEEVADLLDDTLAEEKAADEKLTVLAEEGANTEAEEAD